MTNAGNEITLKPLALCLFLLVFCGDIKNPFEDVDNVRINVTIPPRTDAYKWGVGDTVPVNITVSFINNVDSICVLFGEGDSIPGNDSMFTFSTDLIDDTTLMIEHTFSTTGTKNVKACAFLDDGKTLLNDSDNTELGIKPVIDSLINPGNALIGAPYLLFVKVSGTPVFNFYWYKNDVLLTGETNESLLFNSLQTADCGLYRCIAKSAWGSDTSKTVTLAVEPRFYVTYNGNDATSGTLPSDTNKYISGDIVTVLGNTGNIIKTGFTFSGWNTKYDGTGTTYTAGSTFVMGSADVILYAQWTANPTYSVTYNGNGNTSGAVPVDASSYAPGATVTVRDNSGVLAKTGYTFSGWNTKNDGSGTLYNPGNTFIIDSSSVILYAKWTTNPTYTVTYNGNGNTSGAIPVDANSYETGTTVTVHNNTGNLAKTGTTFVGWNTAANGSGSSYTPGETFSMGSANVILYAQWTTNPTYTVTYNGNGNTSGTVPVDANNYEAGDTVTVKSNSGSLAKTGFTFSGWNTKADGTGSTYAAGSDLIMGSANVVLFAKWTTNPTYTVVYDGNGNTTGSVPVDVNNYEAGDTAIVKSNSGSLVKTGYTFSGWNTKADGTGSTYSVGSPLIMGSANMLLFACWTINQYTLTLTHSTGGTTTGGGLVSHGVAAPVIATPDAGYDFVNWTVTSGAGVSIGDSSSASTTVTLISGNANVRANFQIKTYTLTVLQGTGGTATGGGTVIHGVAKAISATPATGYDFVKWTVVSGAGVSFVDSTSASTTVTLTAGDATVRANFQLKTYTLTVTHTIGGTTTGGGTVSHGVASDISATAGTGYVFVNWTVASGTGVSFDDSTNAFAYTTLTSGNATICANFQIKSYTVTFNSQGGSAVAPQTVNHGAHASAPTPPTRTAYFFDGWFKDSSCINSWFFSNDIVTSNVTIYAKWIVKDKDGNIYTTVTIGTQTWLVENLKTTRYNDSTTIQLVTDSATWANLSSPGYCWYNNDIANKTTFGVLYNWYTVNAGKLAIVGWHIPTDADWDTLQNYLITNGYNWDGTTTGNKIGKSLAAKTIWQTSTNAGAVGNDLTTNNRSCFSAFPSGCRSIDGNFDYFTTSGYWWSATADDTNFAFHRYLLCNLDWLDRTSGHKRIGYSVRLIKD